MVAGCEAPPPAPGAPAPGSGLAGKATVGVILKRTAELDTSAVRWLHVVLVVSDVELHACEQARWAPDWLVSEAYAHVPGSAMRLGTPMAVELTGEPGRAKIIGEAAPPMTAICALGVVLAPADNDVLNTTELEAEQLEGRTFVARGVRADGTKAAVELTMRRVVWVPIEPGALVIRPDDPEVFALVQLRVTDALLAGLDTMTESEAEEALVKRLEANMTLYGATK
jgi:hypothetical protein